MHAFRRRVTALRAAMGFWTALALATAGIVPFAVGARANDLDQCAQLSGDKAIAACTRAIDSGLWHGAHLARAHNARGTAHYSLGDYDRAIVDYNEALRRDPKLSFAYNNLGNALRAKGDDEAAITDYSRAIELDPKFIVAYLNRGNAAYAGGHKDRAFADYNSAIRLDPKSGYAYRERAIANLYAGRVDKASADIVQAGKLNPADPYTALWAEIIGRRSNVPSRLAQATAKMDKAAWPAPLIQLFLGRITPAEVLAAADDPEAGKKKTKLCEANFYGGEFAQRTGLKDDAIRQLQLAARDCPKTFDEWLAANAELARPRAAP
jgi:lipoprotein NlpI